MDIDPTQAATLEEFAECLRHLHTKADKPSYRILESQTKHAVGQVPGTRLQRIRLGRSTIGDVLAARKFPTKAFLLTFVEACGVDLQSDRRWEEAWDRLALRGSGFPSPASETDRLHRENAEFLGRLASASARVAEDEGNLATTGTEAADEERLAATDATKVRTNEFDPAFSDMPPASHEGSGGSDYREGQDSESPPVQASSLLDGAADPFMADLQTLSAKSWLQSAASSRPGPSARGRRAARQPRVPMSAVFAELIDTVGIPRRAYAIDEEVTGAICLVRVNDGNYAGYEVFSCAQDARHEVRLFEEEEAAYFYLFGVLMAEAVRQGRIRPYR